MNEDLIQEKIKAGVRCVDLEKHLLSINYSLGDYRRNEFLIDYARLVIKDRWPEAEELALSNKCTNLIVDYSKNVIKGRWKEGEEVLVNNVKYHELRTLYYYSRYVIKDRWPEAEKKIESYTRTSTSYFNFIKKLVEKTLKNKNYEKTVDYLSYEHFGKIVNTLERKYLIPDVIKNSMIAKCIAGDDKQGLKFLEQDKIFKNKVKQFLEDYKNLTVGDVLIKLG
jgi:hypothetical protein